MGRRIEELIESTTTHDTNSFMDIQMDKISYLFQDFLPVINSTCKQIVLGSKFCDTLLGTNNSSPWDGDTSIGSTKATVFHTWYRNITALPKPEVGSDNFEHPVYLINDLKAAFANDETCCGTRSAADFRNYAINAVAHTDASLNYDNLPAWGS